MTPKQQHKLYSWLYLLSFAVAASWFLLLFLGFFQPVAMTLANEVAIPILLAAVIGLEVSRRLARRAEKRSGI